MTRTTLAILGGTALVLTFLVVAIHAAQTPQNVAYTPRTEDITIHDGDSADALTFVGSFTCPHCRDFYVGGFEEAANASNAQLSFRFHPRDVIDLATSGIIMCLPPEEQAKMVSDAFSAFDDLTGIDFDAFPPDEPISQPLFPEVADILEIDPARRSSIVDCARSNETMDKLGMIVARNETLGVTATPTILVSGKRLTGNISADRLLSVMDE